MAINKIFFDIDNTLIFTDFSDPFQDHITFTLPDQDTMYYTIIRPCASNLIEFSRNLVGHDNVYILTTAIEEYANKINELAEWGFEKDHIFCREHMQKNWYSTAYGGGATAPCSVAHNNNVLIDNLPQRENCVKQDFIGIRYDRYLKIDDYYGNNYLDDPFEDDVIEFLKIKHND